LNFAFLFLIKNEDDVKEMMLCRWTDFYQLYILHIERNV
jgi:hypothetical protein